MLFLSVQPATIYFFWQLDLLLENLHQLGVSKGDIHVLFGLERKNKPNKRLQDFMTKNKRKAQIFTYLDTRKENKYASSLRPHIIAKHLKSCPELEKRTFFYHDSDLLFRALPEWALFENGKTWYVSDTKSYLDYAYLKRYLTVAQIERMSSIVGISTQEIVENDTNVGGAQYIIKNTTSSFWEKMEIDCENLFDYLSSIKNEQESKKYIEETINIKNRSIQAWCADMWALLWNAWRLNIEVKTHDELMFCWPFQHIDKWATHKILHYSGNIDRDASQYFRKQNYIEADPYYDFNLLKIDKTSCSFPLVKAIMEYKESFLDMQRIVLENTVFILIVSFNNRHQLDGAKNMIAWIDKYFSVTVVVIETGENKYWDTAEVHQRHLYFKESSLESNIAIKMFLQNKLTNAKWKDAVIFNDIIIMDKDVIRQNILEIKKGEKELFTLSVEAINVDNIFNIAFAKMLDENILLLNKGKFNNSAALQNCKVLFLCKKGLEKNEDVWADAKTVAYKEQPCFILR